MSFILIDDTHDQTIDGTKSFLDPVRLLTSGDATKYVAVKAPASMSAAWTLTLPDSDGSSGQFLQTDGSGVTTWAAGGGGAGNPSAPDRSIQFNDSGSFGGSDVFQFAVSDAYVDIGWSTDGTITLDPSGPGPYNFLSAFAETPDNMTSGIYGGYFLLRSADTNNANAHVVGFSIGVDSVNRANVSAAYTVGLEMENAANQLGTEIEGTGTARFAANYGYWAQAKLGGDFASNFDGTQIGGFAQAFGSDIANFGQYGKVCLDQIVEVDAFNAAVVGHVAYSTGTGNHTSAGLFSYGAIGNLGSIASPTALLLNTDAGVADLLNGFLDSDQQFIRVSSVMEADKTPLYLWNGTLGALRQVELAAASGGFQVLRVAST